MYIIKCVIILSTVWVFNIAQPKVINATSVPVSSNDFFFLVCFFLSFTGYINVNVMCVTVVDGPST